MPVRHGRDAGRRQPRRRRRGRDAGGIEVRRAQASCPAASTTCTTLAFAAAASWASKSSCGDGSNATAFERLAHAAGTRADRRSPAQGARDRRSRGRARRLARPASTTCACCSRPRAWRCTCSRRRDLFGWPFTVRAGRCQTRLTVPPRRVARPEHFQAMRRARHRAADALAGIAAARDEAGVECTFVGVGRSDPLTPRPGGEREVDVVALTANRWEPFVREVAAQLEAARSSCSRRARNERVLGASPIRGPAVAVADRGSRDDPVGGAELGCVPVALATNRFAVGLTDERRRGARRARRGDRAGDQGAAGGRAAAARAVDSAPRLPPRARCAGARTWSASGGFLRRTPTRSGPAQAARAREGRALNVELEARPRGARPAVRAELAAELDARPRRPGRIHREQHASQADRDRIALERERLLLELQQLSQHPALRIARRLGATSRQNADVS